MWVNLNGKKIAVCTLGCKVNQYESDSVMDALKACGCEVVAFSQEADIYIVNTCAVTNMAERKSRQMLHRAKKLNPQAVVVAVGCYIQAAADRDDILGEDMTKAAVIEKESRTYDNQEHLLQELGVDLLVGNNRKKDLPQILEAYLDGRKVEDTIVDINHTEEYECMQLEKPNERCRAYVKVQDGCNNFCSYCIIPYTRGRTRSRSISDVLQEIQGLAKRGVQEVVLTGINLSSYEDETGADLLHLIQEVAGIEGIARIRLGSLEPRVITKQFLEGLVALPKVCPHFHLSLQSACNDTLKRMNRHYTIEEYMEKCRMIRSYYERPALATDIIVGFPGETEEEFATTYANLEALKLYEMHVFKYSRRSGTPAASMPNQVSDADKDRRSDALLALTAKQKAEYEADFVDEEVCVLVEEYEKRDAGCFRKGHTERYIMVCDAAPEDVCRQSVNTFVRVRYQG